MKIGQENWGITNKECICLDLLESWKHHIDKFVCKAMNSFLKPIIKLLIYNRVCKVLFNEGAKEWFSMRSTAKKTRISSIKSETWNQILSVWQTTGLTHESGCLSVCFAFHILFMFLVLFLLCLCGSVCNSLVLVQKVYCN